MDHPILKSEELFAIVNKTGGTMEQARAIERAIILELTKTADPEALYLSSELEKLAGMFSNIRQPLTDNNCGRAAVKLRDLALKLALVDRRLKSVPEEHWSPSQRGELD